jgi:hypothetical protein
LKKGAAAETKGFGNTVIENSVVKNRGKTFDKKI